MTACNGVAEKELGPSIGVADILPEGRPVGLIFDIENDFRRSVAEMYGGDVEPGQPDDFSEYYDSTVLTEEEALERLEEGRGSNHRFGDIFLEEGPDGETNQIPLDDSGPLVEIHGIRQEAVRLFKALVPKAAAGLNDEEAAASRARQQATFERGARRGIVEIFNSVGQRDNQERILLNGIDLRGLHLGILASRQLVEWRSRLSMHDRQNQYPLLFEAVDSFDDSRIRTPALTDIYLLSYFNQKNPVANQLRGKKLFELDGRQTSNLDLLFSQGRCGYQAAADIFYGGSMQKAYNNLSAVANMTGQTMPAGWQQFQGSTTEFQALSGQLPDLQKQDGVEGYLAVADQYFGGSMLKAHKNLSAVANMTGRTMPAGWQEFQGSTTEFNRQAAFLVNNLDMEDYIQKFYTDAKREKVQRNYSAILNMITQPAARG